MWKSLILQSFLFQIIVANLIGCAYDLKLSCGEALSYGLIH